LFSESQSRILAFLNVVWCIIKNILMKDSVIEVRDFRKVYGDVVAVDGISFEVRQGEIFGLLGPNGAGKTSTLEVLEGLRSSDRGVLRIMGVDPTREPRKLRNLIGVQLQTSGLPDSMRVDEAMRFFSAYHGVAPNYQLLNRLGLSEKMSVQYHTLSTGLQRHLALAVALAHNPPVVLLDEPTAGLDVPSRNELHDLMRELQTGGTTIILATHDMAEAEKMADRVAILLRGRIAATGTPRELTATGADLTKVSARTKGACLSETNLIFPAVSQQTFKDEYAIYYSTDPGPTVSAIIAHIEAQGDTLIDLRVERPSLEERFLEIIGKGSGQ
jgi:ABC-2 type transport system ATP-binding protein